MSPWYRVTNYLTQAMNIPTDFEEKEINVNTYLYVGNLVDLDDVHDAKAGTKFWDTRVSKVRVKADNGFTFEDMEATPSPFGDRVYLVLELPKQEDLSDHDTLVEKLWQVRNLVADTSQISEDRNYRQERTFNALAEFILENFDPKVPAGQKPDKVVDGDGDTWYLASNGLYFHSVSPNPDRNDRPWASHTVEMIRAEFGIARTIA